MPLDSENMLGVLKDFPNQCRKALDLPRGMVETEEIGNIIVLGMGGSAIVGDLLKMYLNDTKIPVFVVRDYKVPEFVNEDSLVFAVSYSGNTEETLSAFRDAKDKGARIIGITSGGKLEEECSKVIKIPGGLQPRAAVGYLFFPMLGVLHNSEIINIKNSELNEMLEILKNVDHFNEMAEQLAKKLKDKIPVLYASQLLEPIVRRWKTQINENAKMPCFYNVFPEMNHNEIVGYRGMDRKFVAVLLRDKKDSERIALRMDISKKLMEQHSDVEEVEIEGESLLSRIMSAVYLGDFVSYHLAIWNHVDPTPVDVVEKLKKLLAKV